MKTIYFFIAVFVSAFFCTSCSKPDAEITPLRNELNVSTNLEAMTSRASFPTSTEMGLFVTSGNLGGVYDNTSANSNVKAVLGVSGWVLTPPVYLSANNATIYAYTPYSASVTSGTSIPVDVTSAVADYCYGKSSGTINAKTPAATLSMQHALTKVRFKISKASTYTGTGKLTEISINGSTNNTICAQGTLNINTGVITATTTSAHTITKTNSSGLYTITASAPTDAQAAVLDFTLIPATFQAKEISMSFTIDGKIFTFSVPAGTWEKSKINTYTLSLGGTGLTMSNVSVTVTEWAAGVSASGELK